MSGVVTGRQVADAGAALYTHPAWQPGYHEIWDLLHVTEFVVAPDELQLVVRLEKEYAEQLGPGFAVVVTARPLIRTMLRLLELSSRSKDRKMLSASTMAEASARLGLAADTLNGYEQGGLTSQAA